MCEAIAEHSIVCWRVDDSLYTGTVFAVHEDSLTVDYTDEDDFEVVLRLTMPREKFRLTRNWSTSHEDLT